MYEKAEKPEIAKQVLDFFAWAYQNGDQMAEELDYVPMPDKVVGLIEKTWKQVKGPNGQAVWAGRRCSPQGPILEKRKGRPALPR